jgi:hypothetical protein
VLVLRRPLHDQAKQSGDSEPSSTARVPMSMIAR